MVRRAIAVGLAAALAATALGLARCGGRASGPNVLLVTIETFRRDHLGAVKNGIALTPNLDRLASRGTRFERAYAAASFTLPSLATIATGEPPCVHGLRFWTMFGNGYREPTLAERMQAKGYATGFVYSAYEDLVAYPLFAKGWTEPPARFDRKDAPEVLAAARVWLDRHDKEPFFLWVHLFEPHTPYAPPEKLVLGLGDVALYRRAGPAIFDVQKDWIDKGQGTPDLADALYAADVRAADDAVRQILEDLERRGLTQRTLVCVSADHGENLANDPAPRWDHGVSADEQLIRIPLVLAGPGVPQGRVDRDLARHLDLAPTLLHAAGVDPPREWRGRDLFGKEPPPAFAIAECTVDEDRDAPMYSVTDGERSLRIWTHPAPWRVELHDETKRTGAAMTVDLRDPPGPASAFVKAWKDESDSCARRRSEVNVRVEDDSALTEAQKRILHSVPYVGNK